jgi:hypothetical protein
LTTTFEKASMYRTGMRSALCILSDDVVRPTLNSSKYYYRMSVEYVNGYIRQPQTQYVIHKGARPKLCGLKRLDGRTGSRECVL